MPCGISPWGRRHTCWAPCPPAEPPCPDGVVRTPGSGADPLSGSGGGQRVFISSPCALSPQAARRRRPGEEAADPHRAMVQSRRTWNLGAPPSLRGLWRVGRAPEEPPQERGMARPAPASPAARPFPHTGPGRLRTGESAFLKCLLISLPSSLRSDRPGMRARVLAGGAGAQAQLSGK